MENWKLEDREIGKVGKWKTMEFSHNPCVQLQPTTSQFQNSHSTCELENWKSQKLQNWESGESEFGKVGDCKTGALEKWETVNW